MHKDINSKNIKFSYLSFQELLLALDRLTRFKFPEISFYRVFSDVLCKHLLEPKLTKSQIFDLDTDNLKSIFEIIWNTSVKNLCNSVCNNTSLNELLKNELMITYNLSDELKNLTDINIDIVSILDLIKDIDNCPINIKRLYALKNSAKSSSPVLIREKFGLRFPVEKIVLCEGITEEILLPVFSRLAGFDFDKKGVKLISAGGKNQVAKLYCELKDELNIPIFILLDADAIEIASKINSVLRSIDKLYLIKHGEFEDIFSLNLIKRTINKRYKNICECSIADFKSDKPMTRILTEFFRIHELGDFQKAEFAKEIKDNIKYKTDLTDEILYIVNEIEKLSAVCIK